jgi:hypothetical protein
MYQVYRLTLDENGTEDCRDFTSIDDARAAFDAAIKRAAVFSADLEYVASTGARRCIDAYQRS